MLKFPLTAVLYVLFFLTIWRREIQGDFLSQRVQNDFWKFNSVQEAYKLITE